MCLTATRLLAVFLRSISKQRAQPMQLLRPGFGPFGEHERTCGPPKSRHSGCNESAVADLSDPMLKNRIAELKAIRDQARADAERAEDAIERLGPSITPQALKTFARQARKRMRTEGGGYRRDHLRALAQRVDVDTKEVRILGSKSVLLRTLVATSSAKTAGFGVTSFVPKWRARNDSNVRPSDS